MVARGRERERDAVHDRHADVGEQELERAFFAHEHIECLGAVVCRHDLVPVLSQRPRDQAADRFLVLGDQNACHLPPHWIPATRSRRLKKRTSTSRASGGGEASRERNDSDSPGPSTLRVGTAVQA